MGLLEKYNLKPSFIGAEGEIDGLPNYINGVVGIDDVIAHVDFSILCILTVTFPKVEKRGILSSEQYEFRGKIESMILDKMDENNLGIHTITQTHNYEVVYSIYTGKKEELEGFINGFVVNGVEINCEFYDDTDWDEYKSMLEGTGYEKKN